MMPVAKCLLDTDTLSEILRGINQTVAARSVAYLTLFARHTISVITVIEIVRGFHRRQLEDRIQRFLALESDMELLTLDALSAELAGRITADLERSGQTIGWADPMIAAIALRHRLTLVTGNLSHYERIQDLGYGLQLDNWRI
jgi:tRNA(fMet)-specific endonuclease VapC